MVQASSLVLVQKCEHLQDRGVFRSGTKTLGLRVHCPSDSLPHLHFPEGMELVCAARVCQAIKGNSI